MTTLTELQDLLAAHTVDDDWMIQINSAVIRVVATDPVIHEDPAAAFAAASALVDRILALGYKLVYNATISAGPRPNDFDDSDAVAYRGEINVGLRATN
jgi:hypothetical protein